ncbi:hypothetical protein ACYSNM_05790 [Myroides sp. LJL116]
MNFSQIQQALKDGTLQNAEQTIKEFAYSNPGHLESRLLLSELLNQLISDLIDHDLDPLAKQIELLTLVEQILDIDEKNPQAIIDWLFLQVTFNFEQTDIERFTNYFEFLKKDKNYFLKGNLFNIDLCLYQGNKFKAIELYLTNIDFAQTIEHRIERDFYVSLYLYHCVYYLCDEEVNQLENALDLIRKHVSRLAYKDTYPIFFFMSVAMDQQDLELVDQLALQIIPVIQNEHQPQSYDQNLEELLRFLIDNHPITTAIAHAYLSLQYCMYGDRKWQQEAESLYLQNPKDPYLMCAYASLLVEDSKNKKALSLLKETMFLPVVETAFIPLYVATYIREYNEVPTLDLSKSKGNPVKLLDNMYHLDQLENELDKGPLYDQYLNIRLELYAKGAELIDNYLHKDMYATSSLMENHQLAQCYHNIVCFILNNEIEHMYEKAIEYSKASQELSFFYYQLSVKCNLYKILGKDQEFAQAIQEYLSYPMKEADPSDYFRFKLQLVTTLTKLGEIAKAIEVYTEVKPELMQYFRDNGTSSFEQSYLVHAFEADDTIAEHLQESQREPIYTPFEYYQFYPQSDDVLFRLAKAYYENGQMDLFEHYADLYFDAYAAMDYMWGTEFYYIMERYLPVCYPTNAEHVNEWLETLVRNNADVPWLDQYVAQFGGKTSSKGFFSKLFK